MGEEAEASKGHLAAVVADVEAECAAKPPADLLVVLAAVRHERPMRAARETRDGETWTVLDYDSHAERFAEINKLGLSNMLSTMSNDPVLYGALGSKCTGPASCAAVLESLRRIAAAKGLVDKFDSACHRAKLNQQQPSAAALQMAEAALYRAIHGVSLPRGAFVSGSCLSDNPLNPRWYSHKAFSRTVADLQTIGKFFIAARDRGLTCPEVTKALQFELFACQLMTVDPIWGRAIREKTGVQLTPEIEKKIGIVQQCIEKIVKSRDAVNAKGDPDLAIQLAPTREELTAASATAASLAEAATAACLFAHGQAPDRLESRFANGVELMLVSRPRLRTVPLDDEHKGRTKCGVGLETFDLANMDGSTLFVLKVKEKNHMCAQMYAPVSRMRVRIPPELREFVDNAIAEKNWPCSKIRAEIDKVVNNDQNHPWFGCFDYNRLRSYKEKFVRGREEEQDWERHAASAQSGGKGRLRKDLDIKSLTARLFAATRMLAETGTTEQLSVVANELDQVIRTTLGVGSLKDAIVGKAGSGKSPQAGRALEFPEDDPEECRKQSISVLFDAPRALVKSASPDQFCDVVEHVESRVKAALGIDVLSDKLVEDSNKRRQHRAKPIKRRARRSNAAADALPARSKRVRKGRAIGDPDGGAQLDTRKEPDFVPL